MKKLLLLLFLVSAGVQAQIVNIPDPVFKTFLLSGENQAQNAAGSYIAIDANNDGEIQQTEAGQVASLTIDVNGMTSMEGIGSFQNLQKVAIINSGYSVGCPITLQGLPNLEQVGIGIGYEVYVDITLNNLPSLKKIGFSNTDMFVHSIFITDCPNVETVEANHCWLGNAPFDLSAMHNLKTVDFFNVEVLGIDVHGTSVENISLEWCAAFWLNADATPNLEQIIISSNYNEFLLGSIGYLSVAGSAVKHIWVEGAYLYVDCSQTTGLEDLSVTGSYTAVADLNLSGCSHLKNLDLISIEAPVIDLTDCTSLETVKIGLTLATSILAKNGVAEQFIFEYPGLEWISPETTTLNERFPNLSFFCIDEDQIDTITNALTTLPVTVVDSYCSFVPGGGYNTMSGSLAFDDEGDGCDPNDMAPTFLTAIGINIDDQYYETFSQEGDYVAYLHATGNYTVQPILVDNPSYFSISPPLIPITLNGTDTIPDLDFCIAPIGVYHDVEVTIAPFGVIRPGYDASYAITYRNKGNQVESGQVNFQFDDDKLDFVYASITPNAIASGSRSWNFSGLGPYESRSILVTVHANSPVETPAVNIGDVMTYNSYVSLLQTDENPADNAFAFHHTVVGAYDPNDITCLEGEVVDPSLIGQFLHYNVNFENTGNYPAENVVVRMKMDASKFDMNTLQFINSSHQPRVQRNGDLVEFIFEGIQLQPEAKGNVLFKIKTKNTLVTGNSVSQKADIYFDFNAPVATNTATTTFQQLSTVTPPAEAFMLWPNPASDVITISGAVNIEAISILNLLGQEVYKQDGNGRGTQVNISSLPSGNYLVRVKAAEGEQLLKLVKK
ncbi:MULTISPECIES: T9SS type A sorting domain-containing protein [unclassified Flavobacterium]|uniref:T9SS type A sorting domain-containing protein n=1 Tax=unclassified Flavobacterium TaxID=196869 RepID=UPI001F12ECDF|nr:MULTISPECIES: T9SS type A sorting domain-containing protein [unclassified Flavobacterium]UMY67007.1 T9SS type A sorting domain-containing protein [Flavobacterium sp. HJ-32-4]